MSSLLGHAGFRRLWAGQTVSVFGDQVTLLALPLTAVLVIHAGPGQMGVLAAAGWLPHLLVSLPAGAWVDGLTRRRAVLVGADLGRAIALASVPLAYVFDAISFVQLLAVALVVGTLSVVFDMAYATFVPLVVPRESIVQAIGKMSLSRSFALVAGPGLGGALVQALSAPVALLADAASFAGSAALVCGVPHALPPVVERLSLRATIADGLRFVLGHPLLRAGVLCTSTINFFNMAFWAIVVLFMSSTLGLSAGAIGLVFSVGAVGGVAGAAVAAHVGRWLGMGPAITIGAVLFPAPLLLFPLASGPEWLVLTMLIVGEFLSSVGVMLFDVNLNGVNVLATPAQLRGRQAGAGRVFVYGVRPLGALAGGVLGAWIGLRPALWIGALGALLGVVFLLASPLPRTRYVADASSSAMSSATSAIA